MVNLAEIKTIYICDGRKKCRGKEFCKAFWGKMKPNAECDHTTDPEHAKFGPCENPMDHPERFELDEMGNWWETEELYS